jgi:signal transduction histidine kinase
MKDPMHPAAKANVLLVDDVPQNLVAMEALLTSDTVHILKAASGAEALELLLVHEVALALLDVQMPEMDGFTLAEFMRGSQRTRDVPIIFLTASPNDPARLFKGYDTGAVDFLHKPIEPRVIRGKVDVFIQLYQQRLLLQSRNASLEQALKLNETMVAVLTHDLRTPLAAITLCSERLRDEAEGTALARTASHVEASARRMARMIDQLLDFSRIRSDVLHMELRDGDIAAIAGMVVDEMRQAHPGRDIRLRIEGDCTALVDTVRISQVLSNLLGNAVQYGDSAAPVTMTIDGGHASCLTVCVQNAGQLPVELIPRLFEPFKGTFHASKGLGLGLYIVEQFVRAHDGQIHAANVPDGVRFEASFPRRKVPLMQAR